MRTGIEILEKCLECWERKFLKGSISCAQDLKQIGTIRCGFYKRAHWGCIREGLEADETISRETS